MEQEKEANNSNLMHIVNDKSDINHSLFNYKKLQNNKQKRDKELKNQMKDVTSMVVKSGNSIYGNKKGFRIAIGGVANFDFKQVKNGFLKAFGKEMNINDMLQTTYENFLKSKENIKSDIDLSYTRQEDLTIKIKENALERKTLAKTYAGLEDTLSDHLSLITILEDQKSNLNKNSNDYSFLRADIDLELVTVSEKKHNCVKLLGTTNSKINALQEKDEIYRMFSAEIEHSIPHLHKLYVISESRVEQADTLIQEQKKSLNVMEDTLNHFKDYAMMQDMVNMSMDVVSSWNTILPEVIGHYAGSSFVDIKSKAKRLQSITSLASNISLLEDSSVQPSLMPHMNYFDCLDYFNIGEKDLSLKNISKARTQHLASIHPDNVGTSPKFDAERVKINYASKVLETYLKTSK